MTSASDTETILESFDNHPALVLPNHGFELDLRQPISNEHFIGHLQELTRCLPYITFSMGCVDDVCDKSLKASPSAETSICKKASSSPDGSHDKPVPPPRTKSYRYSGQFDQDAEKAAVEVLKRPLEVMQAVPVAVANTVKVPQTEISTMSDDKKMSPRVFPDKPPRTKRSRLPFSHLRADNGSHEMCQTKTESSLANYSDNDDANITVIANPSVTMTTVSNPVEEPYCVSHDVRVTNKDNEEQRETSESQDKCQLQTHVQINNLVQENPEEFEEPKKPHPTLSSSTSSSTSPITSASPVITVETEENASLMKRKDTADDVFVVDLEKGQEGVGLGLIDGMHTSLRSQGIFVRKLVPDGTAMQDGRLMIGDRILAVNGTSLVGADYNSAMQLIRSSGQKLRFLVAKSEPSVAKKITASTC